ncbi:MAG TPA: hypothetical protein PKD80_08525 [Microthrixaceae bacterium]|jgi:hypothetical protein|nr:hypothetical protein [Microthrixaceae bacterium]HMT24234.1 hypothetical protein [Microthrixaceae bacterium]HMT62611.1 hypothetical protein [Microthrixaceae bacterium]
MGGLTFVDGSTARALCEQLSSREAAECAAVVGETEKVPTAAGGAADVLAATLRVKFKIASEKGIEVAGGLGLLRASDRPSALGGGSPIAIEAVAPFRSANDGAPRLNSISDK